MSDKAISDICLCIVLCVAMGSCAATIIGVR